MFKSIVYFLLILAKLSNCERYNRLQLPTSSSILTITPRVEVPTMTTNSIQSGFSLKMPIAVQFPSLRDVVQSFRDTLTQTFSDNQLPSASSKLPTLLTPSSPPTIDSNSTRTYARAKFYKSIEKAHSSFGRDCLMRAICEVAAVPFMSASTGLLGEIIDLLLTTSSVKDEYGLMSAYNQAEFTGRKGDRKEDKCKSRYKCPLSLFNIIDFNLNG